MKSFSLFIALFCVFTLKSNGQTSLGAGMPVNEIVNNLKKQVEDLIASTEGVISRQSFDMRQHLMIVSDNLDKILEKNINKSFDRLDQTQQNLITDIEFILSEMQTPINQTSEKMEFLLDKANSVAASFIGGKKVVMVSKIDPLYVTENLNQNVKIIIKGSWLSLGDPYVMYNNTKIYPSYESDSRLEFIIPEIKTDKEKVVVSSYPLTVYQKKKYFGKRKETYVIGVSSVPSLLGNYNLAIRTTYQDTVTINRNKKIEHRNDHCQGERSVILTVNASDGYKIDEKSIKDTHSVTKNSVYHGIRSLTHNGFQLEGIARNSGDCTFFSKDARGSVKMYVNYNEYKIDEKINNEQVISNSVGKWGQDQIFRLPENTKDFILTVEKLNGEKVLISDTYSDKWFKVKYDRVGKRVIISPAPIEYAL